MIKDMICKALEETGLTQKRMAEMLGVPLRTLENWKAGKRTPNEFTAKAIAEKIEEIKELDALYRKNYKTLSGHSVKFHVDMYGRYYYTIEDHSGIVGPFAKETIIEALEKSPIINHQ